jgi:cysteine desulfurase/selenocysteine lyase
MQEFKSRAFVNTLTRTKLVAIAHVSNAIGTVHPIEEIIHLAHGYHAKVLVDGAQSAAHVPIDVQKLDVDFFVFSGHKAYGPTGVGVLYGKKGLLETMPPYQCGGDMIEKVTLDSTTYQKSPLKFEAGTPMIAEVIGLGEALDYIEKIGRGNISQWEQKLLSYATEKLLKIPHLQIIGTAHDKGPIISFVVKDIHPLDIGTLLDLKGICVRTGHQCSQPAMQRFGVTSVTRVSFGLYNTFAEIDYFCFLERSPFRPQKNNEPCLFGWSLSRSYLFFSALGVKFFVGLRSTRQVAEKSSDKFTALQKKRPGLPQALLPLSSTWIEVKLMQC